jgi:type II secretion system protein N
MKERLLQYAKYAGIVGYPLFYALCLVIFASLTFPYDKLKERIVASYNADQRTSGGQSELQIDEVSGYWLSGVRMRGVTLLSAPKEPGKAPGRLSLDEVTVRYALLPMLVGSKDLDFDVRAFDGDAAGSYEARGDDRSFELTLDSIDLGKVGPLVDMLGVPVDGRMAGSVRLQLPEGKASKGTGQVSLEATGVAVGDGKAKLKGALALPRLELGALSIAADAKDGVMKLTKLLAGGKDLDVQGDGRVTLRESVTDSLCDIQVRFRVNDAYRAKNDVTKSLFGAPGSKVPALFELADPKIKQSKRSDGFYAWSMRGPLTRLEFVPAGGGGSGRP